MSNPDEYSDPNSYTVGWICALPSEHTAACSFLDEEHNQPDPDKIQAGDTNAYTLGLIAGHKVVIAVLPHGEYGTTTTATVAANMLRSFTNIKVGLMVGIGGGAPTTKNDIRLGDVVVSSRSNGHGGVYQYDYGKRVQGQEFKHTGHLNQPPTAVLTAMALLESKFDRKGNQIRETVNTILDNNKRLKKKFGRPQADNLYVSELVHPQDDQGRGCGHFCETQTSKLICRRKREDGEDDPVVHFGLIASGNSLMKDALMRDSLASKGILCFEMEAAGLMNNFPCLVVRGICDYSDSHKNDDWQGYAAMTAAAFTKGLLTVMVPKKVADEERLATKLESLHVTTASIHHNVGQLQRGQQTRTIMKWLSPSDPFITFDKALERRHADTCQWLLHSDEYRSWRSTPSSFFWLHGLSGCGKTVLASSIINHVQQEDSKIIIACYYFDVNRRDGREISYMLRSLLFQLYSKHSAARDIMQALYDQCIDGARQPSTRQLMEQFTSIVDSMGEVFVVIDALDECNSPENIVSWLKDLNEVNRSSLHLLVTSQKQGLLSTAIDDWPRRDQIHAVRIDEINRDIASYTQARILGSGEFAIWKERDPDLQEQVLSAVLQQANGMFRLAACQLDALKSCLDRRRLKAALNTLPRSLQEIYTRILVTLKASSCYEEALFMLQYILCSDSPPSFPEMIDAISVRLDLPPPGFVQEDRIFNLMDVVMQCSSLLTVVDLRKDNTKCQEIHLAHSSVREHLTSQFLDRPFDVLLSEPHARVSVAKVSIRYIIDVASLQLEINGRQGLTEHVNEPTTPLHGQTMDVNEFAEYALTLAEDPTMLPNVSRLSVAPLFPGFPFMQSATLWMKHARVIEDGDPELIKLVLELYRSEQLLSSFPPILEYGSYGLRTIDEKFNSICAVPHPLIHACSWGLKSIAQCLLKEPGADVSSCGCKLCGDSPLHAASYNGHLDLVKMLLDHMAHVDGDPKFSSLSTGASLHRRVPLIGASRKGHVAAVSMLLDHRAMINAQGHFDWTAMEVAACQGQFGVVRVLLRHASRSQDLLGPEVYERTMILTARRANYGLVCLLAQMVNWQETERLRSALFEELRSALNEALKSAVQLGCDEDVWLLLQTGLYQRVCLSPSAAVAIRSGYSKKFEMILNRGASPKGCSNLPSALHKHPCTDQQPLLLALSAKPVNQRIVDLLCSEGATISPATSSHDFTRVLMILLNSNELAHARLLLDYGAGVSLKTFDLQWQGTVEQQPFNLVEVLLARGAVRLSAGNRTDGLYVDLQSSRTCVSIEQDANHNWLAVVKVPEPKPFDSSVHAARAKTYLVQKVHRQYLKGSRADVKKDEFEIAQKAKARKFDAYKPL